MDIYVDGSARTQAHVNQCQRHMRRKTKVKEGCGYAVVTDDTIFIKKVKVADGLVAAGTTYMESAALIHAMKIAKTGDTIFTDQGGLTRRLQNDGGLQESRSLKARTNAMIRTIQRLLESKGGITYLYQDSKKAKGKPQTHPARLVDIAAKVGSGVMKEHALNSIKGSRKVVYL